MRISDFARKPALPTAMMKTFRDKQSGFLPRYGTRFLENRLLSEQGSYLLHFISSRPMLKFRSSFLPVNFSIRLLIGINSPDFSKPFFI